MQRKFYSVFAYGMLAASAAQAHFTNPPAVTRQAPDKLLLSWSNTNAVDVYLSKSASEKTTGVNHLGRNKSGNLSVTVDHNERAYFTLIDQRSHEILRVAERVLPLEHGSNFRDVGGYAGAGGKHVRWGLIFRSAGQPVLNDNDLAMIGALNLKNMIDLRSSEERVLAPTKIVGVPYAAVGYSFMGMMKSAGASTNGVSLYRNFPKFLAPQLRIVFRDLLTKDAPIVYNCSAGQDRTGFVTAMILSALGVSRDTIIQDYHLSTQYRRPDYEMPKFDAATQASNPLAGFYAKMQANPKYSVPQPLKDAEGKPFLNGAFAEIDEKYGSLESYLKQEIGIGAVQLAQLRRLYLE